MKSASFEISPQYSGRIYEKPKTLQLVDYAVESASLPRDRVASCEREFERPTTYKQPKFKDYGTQTVELLGWADEFTKG